MMLRRRMQPWLGTFVEVGVADGPAPDRAIRAAFSAVAEVHRLLSFHDPDSDLSRLNRSGHRTAVAVEPLTVRVLRLAVALMRSSGGRFDCTVGGLMERLGALPPPGEAAKLDSGVADDVVILGARRAKLRRPVHVTLDGIAKGYAVDRAVRALTAAGVTSGWVNAGGDLRVVGTVPAPVSVRCVAGFRSVARITNLAVATSATGAPSDPRYPGRIVSSSGARVAPGTWTVAARSAWRADALTKVAPLVAPSGRAAEIARLGGQLIVDGVAA